jgi:dCMP deaminase
MKTKFIDYFMKIAEATSELSSAKRLQVGSVIVKGQQIIGTGYNGMPSGWDNVCEDVVWHSDGDRTLKTKPEVLHSEMNSLMKVTKSTESSEGAIMFCTHAPCMDCAKAIYQSGITKLYYRDTYRDTNGLEFLKRGGVEIEQYKNKA